MQFLSLKKIANAENHSQISAQEWLSIVLLSFVIYVYLSNAFIGQNLHVWGDEITYSAESRNLDFKNSSYPVYLYLSVFSVAHYFSPNFLESARHINALLIALCLPFLYLTARAYTNHLWSILITFTTAFSPITTYAAYFMPDAMFFSIFLVYAWLFLTKNHIDSWVYGAIIGTMAGLMAMIKPHGMFLLMSTLASCAVYFLQEKKREGIPPLIKIIVSSVSAFLLIRIGGGFIFNGSTDLIGAYAMWSPVSWNYEKIQRSVVLGIRLVQGHLIALVAVTGLSVLGFFLPIKLGKQGSQIRLLRIFAACTFLLMFLITILFSMRISDSAAAVDTMRLHMRYYNYVFPLFYILLATHITTDRPIRKPVLLIAAVIAIIALSMLANNMEKYIILPLDSPELRGIAKYPAVLALTGLLVGLTAIWFCFRPSKALKIYLGALLPCTALAGSICVNQDLQARKTDMLGDTAGKMIREALGPGLKRISFFGDVIASNQAQFYAGGAGSYSYVLEPNAPVPEFGDIDPQAPVSPYNVGKTTLPPTSWIMVFGKHVLNADYSPYLSNPEWVLYKKNSGIPIGVPSNLSDVSWLNGISRSAAAFFVESTPALRGKFREGQTLQFADKQLRTVQQVTENGPYTNVFLSGGVLDGNVVGYPHAVELFE